MACDSMRIWYTNRTDVFLFVDWNDIWILSASPMDYDDMRDYIDSTWVVAEDWRYDVEHWNTEDSLESYREDYDYQYSDYYTYDSACDIYYNEDDDYEYNCWDAETNNLADEILDWIEYNINISWDVTIDEFRARVEEFADKVAEQRERQKNKYRVYAYYK